MARTKPIRRSYGAGEWGRNRVRVFPDPKTGLFQIEWRDNGRRLTRSLKHRDWRRAKRQADEFAAGYLGPELHRKAEAESEPLTLETLFDIYGEEVTLDQAWSGSRLHGTGPRRGCFSTSSAGTGRPETLSQRDWDRFIRERRAGRVGPSGKPVANRMIESGPEVPARGPQLGRQVQGRARPNRSLEANPLERPEDTQGEEPNPGRFFPTKNTGSLLQVSPTRSTGGSMSRLCSRTRRGTASGPSASFGGPTSTSKKKWCCGAQSTRRPGFEHRTPVTAEALAALEEARQDQSLGTGTRRSCPRLAGSLDELQPRAGAMRWWETGP